MTIFGHMDSVASIENPDPDNDSFSSTGEVTAAWGAAATVECYLQPGVPGWVQEMFGVMVEADATVFFPIGTDIRPAGTDASARGSKVTIDETVYICRNVQDPAGKGKFLVATLARST